MNMSPPGFLEAKTCLSQAKDRSCRIRGFSPWVGKIPRGGNSNPLQYSYQECPMDEGAWWVTVQGVAKSTWACTMNQTSAGALSQEAADRQGGEVWHWGGVFSPAHPYLWFQLYYFQWRLFCMVTCTCQLNSSYRHWVVVRTMFISVLKTIRISLWTGH